MKPESMFSQIWRSLLAMGLTIAALPIIGLWAIASYFERLTTKKKGG